MPRRRKITIRASELECFETLVRELHQRPEFAGFDPSSLHIWAYERYEPKLKDADAILRRFDYWLGVHKGERYLMANGSRLFNKKELAEALGMTPGAVYKWEAGGLRTDGWSRAAFRSRSAATPSLRPMPFGRYWNGSDRLEKPHHQRGRHPPPSFFIPHRIRLHGSANQSKRMPKPGNDRRHVLDVAPVGIGWR